MYPQILISGPGAELPSAGAAVVALHRRLVGRFGSQRALEAAYLRTLDVIEEDDETSRMSRQPTPFEAAFGDLASQVHARYGLPAQARLFFEVPI